MLGAQSSTQSPTLYAFTCIPSLCALSRNSTISVCLMNMYAGEGFSSVTQVQSSMRYNPFILGQRTDYLTRCQDAGVTSCTQKPDGLIPRTNILQRCQRPPDADLKASQLLNLIVLIIEVSVYATIDSVNSNIHGLAVPSQNFLTTLLA